MKTDNTVNGKVLNELNKIEMTKVNGGVMTGGPSVTLTDSMMNPVDGVEDGPRNGGYHAPHTSAYPTVPMSDYFQTHMPQKS